jgi:hypothetical protein
VEGVSRGSNRIEVTFPENRTDLAALRVVIQPGEDALRPLEPRVPSHATAVAAA